MATPSPTTFESVSRSAALPASVGVSAAFSDAEARIFDNRDPAIAWLNAA